MEQTLQGNDYIKNLAQAELTRRATQERCRYYVPHGGAEEFINICKQFEPGDNSIKIVIDRSGNSWGKSALATMFAGYLSRGISNPWFDCIPYLREFKRPNRGRIFTTPNAATNTYRDEIKKWFPATLYQGHKDGRAFDKRFTWDNGTEFDFFTFDQEHDQAESITLNWAIIDEPMPHRLWGALKTRFRFGGIIFFFLTPLAGASWMDDELEIAGRLGVDVFVRQGDTEEACIEHGVRGFLPHASIEAMFKDFDESELTARKTGSYLHLAGRIYKHYRPEFHEISEIPDYHKDAWEKNEFTLYNIMDPHDRKPFCLGWYAVFKNEDVICVAEWPDESWPPFHKIKDCPLVPSDYAALIKGTEECIGKPADVRLIDPNFGATPTFATKTTTVEEFAKEGLHYRFPPDTLEGGHIKVKGLLGEPGNPEKPIRSKIYFLNHCRNHSYGMVHYGWKENKDEAKGLGEKPELQFKDFPDLVRYGALKKFRYIPKPKPIVLFVPRKYGGSNYSGA